MASDTPANPDADSAKKPPRKVVAPIEQADSATVAEGMNVEGKTIRKDPPAATKPANQETIATVPPEDEAGDFTHDDAPADKAGQVIGDYKLLRKLGQGGMGEVYEAHQLSLDRIVALKLLAPELASKEAFVQRFLREARAMAKVDHPNILRAYGVGKAGQYHYLAAEFISGGSCESWLKKLGKFSIGDTLYLVLQIAHALQHAHEKNIIHRDIKPDNILLTKEGEIKVADLGLAKDIDEDVSLTKTGAGAGTPIYMAPEQARDAKRVDARVDIYALGVMLYVFLTGRPPFKGTTMVELIAAKDKGKFEPLRKHSTEAPPRLDLIVDKMIAMDPKLRFGSCLEVIKELEGLGLANESLSFFAPTAGAEVKKTSSPHCLHRRRSPRLRVPPRRSRRLPRKKASRKTCGTGTSSRRKAKSSARR